MGAFFGCLVIAYVLIVGFIDITNMLGRIADALKNEVPDNPGGTDPEENDVAS